MESSTSKFSDSFDARQPCSGLALFYLQPGKRASRVRLVTGNDQLATSAGDREWGSLSEAFHARPRVCLSVILSPLVDGTKYCSWFKGSVFVQPGMQEELSKLIAHYRPVYTSGVKGPLKAQNTDHCISSFSQGSIHNQNPCHTDSDEQLKSQRLRRKTKVSETEIEKSRVRH